MRIHSNNKQVYRICILLAICLVIFQTSIYAATQKKMVGYLPAYKTSAINSIDFCKLTHLNICFANPDAEGKIQLPEVSGIMSRAREQNPDIIICISLGGGVLPENTKIYWSNLIDNPANRSAFISELIRIVNNNHFDGVDFDLEWDAVTSGYNDFAVQLNDSLKKYDKLFTAALPGAYRYPLISNKALQTFDFINLMVYDETGPWTPDKPGQHSSYDYAVKSINFWRQQGLSADKLILGVPFYGYNFDNISNIFSFSYAQMVNTNTSYAELDKVGEAYYNGRPTIIRKVDLAAEQAGGVMIWEISQDRFDDYSLLKTIHDEFTKLGFTTTGLCGNMVNAGLLSSNRLNIYPIPVRDNLYIEFESDEEPQIALYNIFGQKLNLIAEYRFNKIVVNLLQQENGIYILRIENAKRCNSKRIVIQH